MIITRTFLVEETEDIDLSSHDGMMYFIDHVVQDATIAHEYVVRLVDGETIQVNTDNPRYAETYEVVPPRPFVPKLSAEQWAAIREVVNEEIAAIENGDTDTIEASQERLATLNAISQAFRDGP